MDLRPNTCQSGHSTVVAESRSAGMGHDGLRAHSNPFLRPRSPQLSFLPIPPCIRAASLIRGRTAPLVVIAATFSRLFSETSPRSVPDLYMARRSRRYPRPRHRPTSTAPVPPHCGSSRPRYTTIALRHHAYIAALLSSTSTPTTSATSACMPPSHYCESSLTRGDAWTAASPASASSPAAAGPAAPRACSAVRAPAAIGGCLVEREKEKEKAVGGAQPAHRAFSCLRGVSVLRARGEGHEAGMPLPLSFLSRVTSYLRAPALWTFRTSTSPPLATMPPTSTAVHRGGDASAHRIPPPRRRYQYAPRRSPHVDRARRWAAAPASFSNGISSPCSSCSRREGGESGAVLGWRCAPCPSAPRRLLPRASWGLRNSCTRRWQLWGGSGAPALYPGMGRGAPFLSPRIAFLVSRLPSFDIPPSLPTSTPAVPPPLSAPHAPVAPGRVCFDTELQHPLLALPARWDGVVRVFRRRIPLRFDG
ncbi:hypothetical protein C8J57DRAFT_1724496 [Mycena rebaudengoi]|nr:hypothetical protein C8J57DRAFT_1724496 [Mycena rebaudengoi]